jgi:hypothetical protein
MTEQNQTQTLFATLREALQRLEFNLELTRSGVDGAVSQAERLRAGVAALGALRQRDPTVVGIDMLVDAALDFLEAFHAVEDGLLAAQTEVDTLEAELADEEDGREA